MPSGIDEHGSHCQDECDLGQVAREHVAADESWRELRRWREAVEEQDEWNGG